MQDDPMAHVSREAITIELRKKQEGVEREGNCDRF
jgi:hypothetical protein